MIQVVKLSEASLVEWYRARKWTLRLKMRDQSPAPLKRLSSGTAIAAEYLVLGILATIMSSACQANEGAQRADSDDVPPVNANDGQPTDSTDSSGQFDGDADTATACSPGESGCRDNAVWFCNSQHTWQFANECSTTCRDGACSQCTPGDARCEGKGIGVCNEIGSEFEVISTCGDSQVCVNAKCCVLSCNNRDCGSDGCGGSCGECTLGDRCQIGRCTEDVCGPHPTEACIAAQCGGDPESDLQGFDPFCWQALVIEYWTNGCSPQCAHGGTTMQRFVCSSPTCEKESRINNCHTCD